MKFYRDCQLLLGFYSELIQSYDPFNSAYEEKITSEPFMMSQKGRTTFALIKDLLSKSSQLVIISEENLLILHEDASTKATGGVLM